MKKFTFMFFILLFSCMLTGCVDRNSEPEVRVVIGITVTATGSENNVTHTYTQDKKMSQLLNYLRLLDPYISITLSPDTFRTDTYQITVRYSDGGHTRYNQIYHDYFQIEDGAWKRIDSKQGANLQKIIDELEADI